MVGQSKKKKEAEIYVARKMLPIIQFCPCSQQKFQTIQEELPVKKIKQVGKGKRSRKRRAEIMKKRKKLRMRFRMMILSFWTQLQDIPLSFFLCILSRVWKEYFDGSYVAA